jgi:hypothetical protein
MSGARNVDPVPCVHAPRCHRLTLPVKIVKARGVPVAEILDATPVEWVDGARIKLLPSDHLPRGQQLAKLLTVATVGQAFAAELFIPHREVCEAEQRRTKRKVKGVAA